MIMESYIGTKVVNATPMNRLEYNALRGWVVPTDENPNDAGYLVEYTDGGKANVPGYSGYVSWSPKEQFDNAYRATGAMTFGLAIEALKQGKRVARAGWNGKGMWLSLSSPPSPSGIALARIIPADAFWSHNNRAFAEEQGGFATVLPCITMKTATGEILMGWLASQTDMLAEDWRLVP